MHLVRRHVAHCLWHGSSRRHRPRSLDHYSIGVWILELVFVSIVCASGRCGSGQGRRLQRGRIAIGCMGTNLAQWQSHELHSRPGMCVSYSRMLAILFGLYWRSLWFTSLWVDVSSRHFAETMECVAIAPCGADSA